MSGLLVTGYLTSGLLTFGLLSIRILELDLFTPCLGVGSSFDVWSFDERVLDVRSLEVRSLRVRSLRARYSDVKSLSVRSVDVRSLKRCDLELDLLAPFFEVRSSLLNEIDPVFLLPSTQKRSPDEVNSVTSIKGCQPSDVCLLTEGVSRLLKLGGASLKKLKISGIFCLKP